ncbi:MAG: glycogen synthase GlgA [Gammaproteobacteria bacterium]|nr:glycogen synthase GlgA [Gammaproteobacteria bacterium]
MTRVLFVTSEATPFAQTGGLGEVCGSLPKSLAQAGCEVKLVLPAYGAVKAAYPHLSVYRTLQLLGYPGDCAVLSLPLAPRLDLWLVDAPLFFDRPGGPYADAAGREWHDNPHRFACFARAVAVLAEDPAWRPDVVHCNDWPTGLVPALLSARPQAPPCVFTIHNLAFAGLCDRNTFEQLQLPPTWWHYERLEFHGSCSFLKGGVAFAERLTTVSPTYAQEILSPALGQGLDGLLRHRARALRGILNGIDTEIWNPATDPLLAARFSATELAARAPNKATLQARFGLPCAPAAPLLGVVSRLTEQKGLDLLLAALPVAVGEGFQCVMLGGGEPALEAAAGALAGRYPQAIAVRFGYDAELAHQIFAGVDAFVMPSRFEPCGLSQLYSQRYGALPVVRRTGGLGDSVDDGRTGFVFGQASPEALLAALRRVAAVWRQPAHWQAMQRAGMAEDFSWARSAGEYLALYRSLER